MFLNFCTTQLKNEHVTLKVLSFNDYSQLKKIAFDSEIWEYFPEPILTDNDLQNFINNAIFLNLNNEKITFSIIENINNTIVGSTSFLNYSKKDSRIEIGFSWIEKKYQRNKVNKASKVLLIEYAFNKLSCNRIEFKTDVLNKNARMALLHLGAIEEGILRQHTLMPHSRYRDTIYYSILKNEWENIKMKNNLYIYV